MVWDQEIIKVSRGEVEGIGKLKIPRTADFNYEIPMLSFLVIKEKEGEFVSSCIHLQVDGYGTADDSAIADMIINIEYFLKANFSRLSKQDAWLNLIDLSFVDKDNMETWNAYRNVQFRLAALGIPTDNVENLRKKIDQMQRRIEQLEKENEKLEQELSLIVEYTPLREVA